MHKHVLFLIPLLEILFIYDIFFIVIIGKFTQELLTAKLELNIFFALT